MARVPDDELNRIKNAVPLAPLIESSGVQLQKRGADLFGLCPFHDDKEPSLVVTPAKNVWRCFSCQVGGSAIDWVMKTRSVSFRHAVELLRVDIGDAPEGRELPPLAKRKDHQGARRQTQTPPTPPTPPQRPTPLKTSRRRQSLRHLPLVP